MDRLSRKIGTADEIRAVYPSHRLDSDIRPIPSRIVK